jgi:hypothetical protein
MRAPVSRRRPCSSLASVATRRPSACRRTLPGSPARARPPASSAASATSRWGCPSDSAPPTRSSSSRSFSKWGLELGSAARPTVALRRASPCCRRRASARAACRHAAVCEDESAARRGRRLRTHGPFSSTTVAGAAQYRTLRVGRCPDPVTPAQLKSPLQLFRGQWGLLVGVVVLAAEQTQNRRPSSRAVATIAMLWPRRERIPCPGRPTARSQPGVSFRRDFHAPNLDSDASAGERQSVAVASRQPRALGWGASGRLLLPRCGSAIAQWLFEQAAGRRRQASPTAAAELIAGRGIALNTFSGSTDAFTASSRSAFGPYAWAICS